DDTLFCFFGSITRYVLLAFALIAILGRIGAETTSIVALIGLAYNDNTDDARKVIEGV
ncbi:MAG: small conductance mechanosensitive channel, partial [Pseudomonadales bacterium]